LLSAIGRYSSTTTVQHLELMPVTFLLSHVELLL